MVALRELSNTELLIVIAAVRESLQTAYFELQALHDCFDDEEEYQTMMATLAAVLVLTKDENPS